MLRFEGVRKRLGDREVIRGIDLEVEAGRTTVLIGPSGCGKSTLLRLLVRLLVPDAGRVYFGGDPVGETTAQRVRHRTGYVIQDGGLFPHLTARDNVTLMAGELGWERDRTRARLESLLARILESSAAPDARETPQLTEAERDALRALGYLE